MRFGPFAVSTANLAVTGSILFHVLLGIGLLAGRFNPAPPIMQVAQGEEAADVAVQFLSPEQLQDILEPKPQELTQTQPVDVPEVPIEPPTPVPHQMATVDVLPESLDVSPIEKPQPADLPVVRPPQLALHHPVEAESTEPATKPQPAPPPTAAATQPAGVDRQPREIDLPRPKYPMLSRRLGEEGEVVLSATIGVDGKARDIRVDRSPGHQRLIEAAIAALQAARFEPARIAGRPTPQRVSVPFNFRLER